jgi:hypothetical protein
MRDSYFEESRVIGPDPDMIEEEGYIFDPRQIAGAATLERARQGETHRPHGIRARPVRGPQTQAAASSFAARL